jgi:hypothetical protein
VPTPLAGFMPRAAGAPNAPQAPHAGGKGGNTVEPPPLAAFPDKPTADTVQAYTQRWRDLTNANSDANTGYQNQMQIYKNLQGILKTNPNIGPGSAGLNQMQRYLTPFGVSTQGATGYQEVVGYLDRLAQTNAGRAGVSTDYARQQTQGATGTPDFSNTALNEKLRFGAATTEGANAFTKAISSFQANYGPRAQAFGPQFESAWAANADPVAFRLMSAKTLGDTEDYKATLSKASPQTVQHYANLLQLMQGRIPRQ